MAARNAAGFSASLKFTVFIARLRLVKSWTQGMAWFITALNPDARIMARYGNSGTRASWTSPKPYSLLLMKSTFCPRVAKPSRAH